MNPGDTLTPSDRPAFNRAMAGVLHDHETLRHLAKVADTTPELCTDIALSMAELMIDHERTEARLFDLPFVTIAPQNVATTAALARRRCIEYTSGDYDLPSRHLAASRFIDALMDHLAAEEAWFDAEKEHQKERLRIAA